MTQEFDLSVTPVGNNQYLVRTERVPYGASLAQEQVIWDIDTWLAQARQLMSDPLQGLLQSDPAGDASLSRSSLNLIALGQELYAALFRGTLRDSWVIAQGVAQNRREALRLRLGLKGPDLPRLPWEVMYGTDVPVEQLRQGNIVAAPRPLATGTRISFSRYQLNIPLEENFSVFPLQQHSLRILMVVSAPTDQEQLKLYREVKHMQQELQLSEPRSEVGADPIPEIKLEILNQPDREELTRALEQRQFQVLHYAGHSDLSAAGGSLYLVNKRTGLTEILTGDDLAGLLVNNGIRLAVFNSCRGSYTAAADPSSGRDRNLAETLMSRGIPSVLAMAEQIPDNVALNLTSLFYRSLKLGYPIDLSLNRARQGLISAYGSHQFYWALPVLYLHPEFDGYLLAHDSSRSNLADRFSQTPARPTPVPIYELHPRSEMAAQQPVRSAESYRDTLSPPDADSLDLLEESPEESDQLLIADMLQQLSPYHSIQPTTSASASAMPISYGAGESLPPQPVPEPTSHTAVIRPKPRRSPLKRWLGRFLLLPILGAAGVAAYAALQGTLPWLHQSPTAEISTEPTPPTSIDLSQTTAELKALASDAFNEQQNDLGIAAVEALLDREARPEASEALTTVSEQITEDPRINFLRGRLAWQGMKAADGHTVAQARNFWEKAFKDDPETLAYQEALGFAYYAENNLDKALKTWWEARSKLSDKDSEALKFDASLALVLQKTVANQPSQDQDDYLLNAIQLYQKVMNRDSDHYNPIDLRQNWLWTEAAVKDWESLGELAKKRGGEEL